jgi:hypothetical protein
VHVEDAARAGHDLDGFELVLPVLEDSRRQTGRVWKRASGDAVLDSDPMAISHGRILAN